MRWMRYLIFFIMLVPSQVLAQQHSEAVCLLLQQQIDRYASQKSHPNYRSARREYDKNCYKAPPRQPRQVEVEPTVTEKPQPRLEYKRAARPAAKPQSQQLETTPAAADSQTQLKNETQTAIVGTDKQSAIEPVDASTSQDNTSAPQNDISTQNATESTLDAAADKAGSDFAAESEFDAAVDLESEATDTAPADVTPEAVAQTVMAPGLNTTAKAPLHSETEQGDAELQKILLEILQATPLVAANIVAFLLVVFLLTNWLGLNLPGFKGVFAEYKLNRLLRWRLPKEYQHFRKLRLTNDNNETTVIDHLVLSPYGIFVIMVKGYRGRISGSESQANWMRDYLGNSKQFMNPLHQNFKNLQALKQLLELTDFELLHSVIAFARVGQFASEMPANITYIDTTSGYIKQCSDRCISDEQLARFTALIRQTVN
jgi:hypothetical protein